MRRCLIVAAFALLGLLCRPIPGWAQTAASGAVSIEVHDGVDGRPLQAALVGFPELSRFTLTDSSGLAVLQALPAGNLRLEVVVVGYGKVVDTLRVTPGGVAERAVGMSVQPFEVEGITVDGKFRWSSSLERSGFYVRSRSGVGRFFDRNDLEDRLGKWSTLGQALQRRPLGLCQSGSRNGIGSDRGASSFRDTGNPAPRRGNNGIGTGGTSGSSAVEARASGGDGSRPIVFVDGTRWVGSLEELPYDMVDALEIYRSSPNLPVQYSGLGIAPCGVVLVWMSR